MNLTYEDLDSLKYCIYCTRIGHSIQNCNNEQFQIIHNNFYNIYISSFIQSHNDFITPLDIYTFGQLKCLNIYIVLLTFSK
jgi:hypothetical protein